MGALPEAMLSQRQPRSAAVANGPWQLGFWGGGGDSAHKVVGGRRLGITVALSSDARMEIRHSPDDV